jgi:hypothetical protein
MFEIDDLDIGDDTFEVLHNGQHAMSWLFKDDDPAAIEEVEGSEEETTDEEEISHYDTEEFLQYLGLDRISELEKLFADVMKVSVQKEEKPDKKSWWSWWSWWWNGEEDENVKKNQ